MKTLLSPKKAPLLAVCLTCLLAAGCSGGDFGSDKHVDGPYTITSIGDCGGGEGFFGGNRTCAISIKDGYGNAYFGETWDRVMPGQEVYRECWKEDGIPRCSKMFTSSPRRMYTSGS